MKNKRSAVLIISELISEYGYRACLLDIALRLRSEDFDKNKVTKLIKYVEDNIPPGIGREDNG